MTDAVVPDKCCLRCRSFQIKDGACHRFPPQVIQTVPEKRGPASPEFPEGKVLQYARWQSVFPPVAPLLWSCDEFKLPDVVPVPKKTKAKSPK